MTVVPYPEFVARRDRRLRMMAELRSEARAQAIEGEVLHVHAEERATPAEGESRNGTDAIDGRGTEQNEQPHLPVFRRSLRFMRPVAPSDER